MLTAAVLWVLVATLGRNTSSASQRSNASTACSTPSAPSVYVQRKQQREEEKLSSSMKEKRALRDAVVAVATGQICEHQIWGEYGVAQRRVMRHVESLPADITNSGTSKALTRAAAIQVGYPVRGTYTTPELRGAIIACLGHKKLKYTTAYYRFGPDPRTISKHCQRVKKVWDKHPESTLEEIVNGMEFQSGGAKPYFTPDETKFLLLHATACSVIGEPQGMKAVCARARAMCMKMAEDETDPDTAARLRAALCGKRWYKRAVAMYGEELGLKSSLIKTKGLSIRRAQANAAGLTKEMFQRIDAMYEEHCDWVSAVLKLPG